MSVTKLLKLFMVLFFVALIGVPDVWSVASVAVTADATQAVATITSDATTAAGYIQGGTFTIDAGSNRNDEVSVILTDSVTPSTVIPGEYTVRPPGEFSALGSTVGTYDNVWLEVWGVPNTAATADESIPILVVNQYKKPFFVDVRPYTKIFIRFYFKTATITQFKVFFRIIDNNSVD